jgi:hypothetical protein
MSTTFAPQIGPPLTLGNTLRDYPEVASTDWLSLEPPIALPVPAPVPEPPVQVAPFPRIQTHSVAARHRDATARSRNEDKIAVWVAYVMACVTVILSVKVATVLGDLMVAMVSEM